MTPLNKSYVSYTYYLEVRNVLVEFILHSLSRYANSDNVDCRVFFPLLCFSNELIFMFKLLIFLVLLAVIAKKRALFHLYLFSTLYFCFSP